MKKSKVTRSLLAAVSVVALSAVMYGCVHSGDGPTVTPVSLTGAQAGQTLQPGTYKPDDALTSAIEGASDADIDAAAGTHQTGATITLAGLDFSCESGPCSVTVNDNGTVTTTGTIRVMAHVMPPATVSLAGVTAGYTALVPTTHTIKAGESANNGDVEFSCAAGGGDCTVTVAADGTVTSTGGTVTAGDSDAYAREVAAKTRSDSIIRLHGEANGANADAAAAGKKATDALADAEKYDTMFGVMTADKVFLTSNLPRRDDVGTQDGSETSSGVSYKGIGGVLFCAGSDCKIEGTGIRLVATDKLTGSWYFAPSRADDSTYITDAGKYSYEDPITYVRYGCNCPGRLICHFGPVG